MLALELNDDFDGETLSNQLFEGGFVIGFKLNTLRFLPPLTIKENDIDKLIKKLEELLSKSNTISAQHVVHYTYSKIQY